MVWLFPGGQENKERGRAPSSGPGVCGEGSGTIWSSELLEVTPLVQVWSACPLVKGRTCIPCYWFKKPQTPKPEILNKSAKLWRRIMAWGRWCVPCHSAKMGRRQRGGTHFGTREVSNWTTQGGLSSLLSRPSAPGTVQSTFTWIALCNARFGQNILFSYVCAHKASKGQSHV